MAARLTLGWAMLRVAFLAVPLSILAWGWKESRQEYTDVKPGDWIVMGSGYTGGSVRVSEGEWRRHRHYWSHYKIGIAAFVKVPCRVSFALSRRPIHSSF